MKKILGNFLVVIALVSCHKNKTDNEIISSPICFDTTLMKTNIQEILLSVFFVNGKDGYVAGSKGGIYKTTDSAKTWTNLNAAVNLPILNLYFLNAQTGFAVGGENYCTDPGCIPGGAFILKTSDAGQSWTRVYAASEKTELLSISFVNDSIGFCVGNNLILKTLDGGDTWAEYKNTTLESPIVQVKFVDSKTGFIVCSHRIVKTSDGGVTWNTIAPKSAWRYYTASGSNSVIYLAGQGKIIKSNDAGRTWNELPNSPMEIHAIQFIDDNNGFAFGGGNYSGGDFGYSFGSIYCTNDGGATWNGSPNIQTTRTITEVSFPNKKIGYTIGWNNVLRLTQK